jgi:site-specific DNA recombinase
VIVDDEIWNAAQVRRAQARAEGPHFWDGKRPKTLLSGLVRCRLCGRPMAKNGDYFRCTGNLNSGICSNGRGTSVHQLEQLVIDAVKATLTDSILIARFAEVFRSEVEKRLAEHNMSQPSAARRLAEISTKIANLTRSLERGLDSEAVRQRLAELEAERRTLAPKAEPARSNVKRLIPDAHVLAARQAANENLAKDLRGTDLPALRLREAFRSTIAEVRTGPAQDGQIATDVDGNIKGILHLAGCPIT